MDKPKELEQLEHDYRVQFGGLAGERILEDLKAQGNYNDSLFRPGDDALALAYLEGRRSIVIYILGMIEDADKPT